MSKPIAFVFNDETIQNTYGFSIVTEGIDLTRFAKNPVMLSDHYNSNWNVMGKWYNFSKNGSVLSGFPEFDTEDQWAKELSGKVERGFINACSMGIIFDSQNLTVIDGRLILTKCELVEVSIVPVPSNANSVRLFNLDGKPMPEKELKELTLSIIPSITNPQLNLNIDNMKKITLSVATLMVLGFKDQPTDGLDVVDVEAKVLDLSARLTALTTENEGLKLAAKTAKDAEEAAVKLAATQKVDLAITQGKIPADKKEAFVQLGITSPEVLEATLAAIPGKKNLGAGVKVPNGDGTATVATMDDFQKLSVEAQLAFKNDSPEEYKKLFS